MIRKFLKVKKGAREGTEVDGTRQGHEVALQAGTFDSASETDHVPFGFSFCLTGCPPVTPFLSLRPGVC